MTQPTRATLTFDQANIPVFLNSELLRLGVPAYIGWDATSSTQKHWLIGGNSGAGKSTHMILCLAKASKYLPTARLYLMDFKGSDDFRYLRDIPNARYFSYEKCADGLGGFSEEIESRLQNNPDRAPIFAVFDEYASFISYTSIADKKLAAQCQSWMMNALFMSRSVGGYCWLCTQRPDQSIMPSGGARDQLGVRVWWGRFSSPDAARIMFGDMEIPQNFVGGVGQGIAYMDGKGLFEVTAPRIKRMEAVREAIVDFVTR